LKCNKKGGQHGWQKEKICQRKVGTYIKKIGLGTTSCLLLAFPSFASEPVQIYNDTMTNEGGKEVLNRILKAIKSTPEVKTVNTIVYLRMGRCLVLVCI